MSITTQWNNMNNAEAKLTMYDLRGEWATTEHKEVILKQLNEKIDLLLTHAREEGYKQALEMAIKLSDNIEMSQPDGGIGEWMAFKHFRNTLRDRLLDTPLQPLVTNKLYENISTV